jgi:hypothetical protein
VKPIFSQRFLKRLGNGKAHIQQQAAIQELVSKARAAGHTGPLVVGPSPSGLKHSWRDDAKWLEENFAEDFGEPKPEQKVELLPAIHAASSDICHSFPGQESAHTPSRPPSVPGSSRSSSQTVLSPVPVPPLPSSFWQTVLSGNPDSLVSGSDATRALYLLSDKLGIAIVQGEGIETLRAGAFRKLLRDRFGGQKAELTMNELWRSAPASPGAPVPNADQSHCSPGVWECPRSMPAWRQEMSEPGVAERDWQIENGCWCG